MQGRQFGRYRLEHALGRGGMGEVWRAYDSVAGRTVAIKVISAHLSHDPAFQARFRREAQAAQRLQSPHVIPVHGVGEIDGQLYVDMELIDGRDLHTVLTTHGPLAPERAVRIVEQVADALQAAHVQGYVHRDVKPSNILVDRNGFAYLIDFGVARAVDDTRVTSPGAAVGTLAYVAPERLSDRPREDGRVDVYALACVLYECLTAQPPFAGTSVASLVGAHLNTPPPRPSLSGVPARFDEVIARGMAKDPDRRYATAVELARAARRALPARSSGGGWARYRRTAVTAAWVAAIVALFAVSVVLFTRQPSARTPVADDTPSHDVTTSESPSSESTAGFSDTATCGAADGPKATLREMRHGRHEDYDRVVLEFDGVPPQCTAEFVDQLTADGSGLPVSLPGNAFLSVGMFPSSSAGDDGRRAYTGPDEFETPDLTNVVAVTITGDFEGYLHVGVGMRDRTHYQVFSLADPTRVVIDVGH